MALTWDTADIQDNEAVCFMEAPADDACIVFRIEPVVAATASGVVR